MATREDIERPTLRAREHTLIGDPEKNLRSSTSYEKEISTTDAHPEDIVGRGAPTPIPKYSSRWWNRTWEKMVQEERWPRVFYSLAFLVLLGVWIGIMFAFGRNQIKFEAWNNSTRNTTAGSTSWASIGLKGNLVQFDPSKRSLTITWSGTYISEDTEKPVVVDMGDINDPIGYWDGGLAIFRDVEAYPKFFPNTSFTNLTTYEVQSLPNFDPNNTGEFGSWGYAVDNATALPIALIGQRTWDSFDTDIPFQRASDSPSVIREPMFGYPFDRWTGNIVFVATWLAMGQGQYNSSTAGGIEIAHAQLLDSTLNWRFKMITTDTCNRINETDSNNFSTWQKTCHTKLDFTADRPGLVMFAATIAVLVNWLSTAFIFILTSESIILRRGYMLEGTDLLSVCFTALFALPSVRLLLPGAPDFGALIDLVGIIPNVIIISLCTCIVCIAKLYRSPEYERARAEKLE